MIQLINSECLEAMKSIPDASIDAIITDPPYGTTACKWDSVIDFELMWEQLNRIIKPNGAIVLFGSEPFSSLLRVSNIKNFKYDWVWYKQKASNFMSAKYSPLKYHELISVFSNKTHQYNPQKYKVLELSDIEQLSRRELRTLMESRDYDRYGKVDRRKTINDQKTNKEHVGSNIVRTRTADTGYRNPKSIISINKSINGNVHPTQKPVELMEYLIKTYTNENETVLDFTMGSGSTGVACVNTNRSFIGIEMDEGYFNTAKSRIEESEYKLF